MLRNICNDKTTLKIDEGVKNNAPMQKQHESDTEEFNVGESPNYDNTRIRNRVSKRLLDGNIDGSDISAPPYDGSILYTYLRSFPEDGASFLIKRILKIIEDDQMPVTRSTNCKKHIFDKGIS